MAGSTRTGRRLRWVGIALASTAALVGGLAWYAHWSWALGWAREGDDALRSCLERVEALDRQERCAPGPLVHLAGWLGEPSADDVLSAYEETRHERARADAYARYAEATRGAPDAAARATAREGLPGAPFDEAATETEQLLDAFERGDASAEPEEHWLCPDERRYEGESRLDLACRALHARERGELDAADEAQVLDNLRRTECELAAWTRAADVLLVEDTDATVASAAIPEEPTPLENLCATPVDTLRDISRHEPRWLDADQFEAAASRALSFEETEHAAALRRAAVTLLLGAAAYRARWGEADAALEDVSRARAALATMPEAAPERACVAPLLLVLERTEEALEYLDAAPGDPEEWIALQRAWALVDLGRWDDALAAARQARPRGLATAFRARWLQTALYLRQEVDGRLAPESTVAWYGRSNGRPQDAERWWVLAHRPERERREERLRIEGPYYPGAEVRFVVASVIRDDADVDVWMRAIEDRDRHDWQAYLFGRSRLAHWGIRLARDDAAARRLDALRAAPQGELERFVLDSRLLGGELSWSGGYDSLPMPRLGLLHPPPPKEHRRKPLNNRFGIEGPEDNQDPELARQQAREQYEALMRRP